MTWRVLFPEGSRSQGPEAPSPLQILIHFSSLRGMLFTVRLTLKLEVLLKLQQILAPKASHFREPEDMAGGAGLDWGRDQPGRVLA